MDGELANNNETWKEVLIHTRILDETPVAESHEWKSEENGSSRMVPVEIISVPASPIVSAESALKPVESVSKGESENSETSSWACGKQLNSYFTPESDAF